MTETVEQLQERGYFVKAFPARYASALVNYDLSSTDLDSWDRVDIMDIIETFGFAVGIVEQDPYFGTYIGDGLGCDMCRYVFDPPELAD